jgi:Mg2+ and Co2+ transporter CorA
VDVYLIAPAGTRDCSVAELPALVAGNAGLIWVDIPEWDAQVEDVLRQVFDFHPLALHDCAVRTRVPKLHVYSDHVFLVLHSPHLGAKGHVHYIELDRFIGSGFLVTVHGPVNAAVPPGVVRADVDAVLRRLRSGHFSPTSSFELSHAVVSSMARRMEQFLEDLTERVWALEQEVTLGDRAQSPEEQLEAMFQVRHGLLTLGTMSAQAAEIYRRLAVIGRVVPDESRSLVTDLIDQFDRLGNLAGQELTYLDGVIAFFRTRTDTRMMIAGERLAVIAVLTLPMTALASVLGMNLMRGTEWLPIPVAVVLITMIAMSVWLLRWTRKQGWW